ncbi:hypothetical protein MMC18_008960 [Xylographa bjoerkii]|nr:hypothetical protein [Xylographa bjoerkii]
MRRYKLNGGAPQPHFAPSSSPRDSAQREAEDILSSISEMPAVPDILSSIEEPSVAFPNLDAYFDLPDEIKHEALWDTNENPDFQSYANSALLDESHQLQTDEMSCTSFAIDIALEELQMTDMSLDEHNQGKVNIIDADVFSQSQMDALSTPDSWSSGFEVVPPELLLELYRCYFATVHHSLPMMDQDEFLSGSALVTKSGDMLALRYIMCAHSANFSPRFTAWAVTAPSFLSDSDYSAWFYREAKYNLEPTALGGQTERSSIAALQATILVGLYELKLAYFSRAWATISCATWLAQMLQLHKLDQRDASECALSLTLPPCIPTPFDELNEARRTLWAVLTLNSFVGVGVSWNVVNTMDQNDISTYLPREDTLAAPAAAILRLDDAMGRSAAWPLSAYQGTIVAAALCARTVAHVKSVNRGDSLSEFRYNFWIQKYRLDEAVRYVVDFTLHEPALVNNVIDARKLMCDLMLKATSICLHRAVVVESGMTKINHTAHAEEHEASSCEYAIDIARLLQTNDLNETIETNIFLPWIIYVSLQALIRGSKTLISSDERLTAFSAPSSYQSAYSLRHNATAPCSSAEAWTGASVLGSTSILRGILRNLKSKSALAGVFHDEIEQELGGGDQFIQERPVGLVTFPLACALAKY